MNGPGEPLREPDGMAMVRVGCGTGEGRFVASIRDGVETRWVGYPAPGRVQGKVAGAFARAVALMKRPGAAAHLHGEDCMTVRFDRSRKVARVYPPSARFSTALADHPDRAFPELNRTPEDAADGRGRSGCPVACGAEALG